MKKKKCPNGKRYIQDKGKYRTFSVSSPVHIHVLFTGMKKSPTEHSFSEENSRSNKLFFSETGNIKGFK